MVPEGKTKHGLRIFLRKDQGFDLGNVTSSENEILWE